LEVFKAIDKDGDGQLTKEELKEGNFYSFFEQDLPIILRLREDHGNDK